MTRVVVDVVSSRKFVEALGDTPDYDLLVKCAFAVAGSGKASRRAEFVAMLKRFGVMRLSQLRPDQYADALSAMRGMLK